MRTGQQQIHNIAHQTILSGPASARQRLKSQQRWPKHKFATLDPDVSESRFERGGIYDGIVAPLAILKVAARNTRITLGKSVLIVVGLGLEMGDVVGGFGELSLMGRGEGGGREGREGGREGGR